MPRILGQDREGLSNGEATDLSGSRGHHGRGPAGGGGDAALLDGVLRQPFQHLRSGPGGAQGSGFGPRQGGGYSALPARRDRLHGLRHRVRQSRPARRVAWPAPEGQPHHHHRHRASCGWPHGRAVAEVLWHGSHLSAGGQVRHGEPGRRGAGDQGHNRSRQRHVCQQRDRHHPAHRRDRARSPSREVYRFTPTPSRPAARWI